MYTLIVDGTTHENLDKATLSVMIGQLSGDEKKNYKVLQDVTNFVITPEDWDMASRRNRRIEALANRIDFSLFDFQMSEQMRKDSEEWNKLMKEQSVFEANCGF